MPKIESSGALRNPLLFGWKIDDPNNDNLLGCVKLIESLGISFLVLDLNTLSAKLGSNGAFQHLNHVDNSEFCHSEEFKLLIGFSPLGKSDLALPNELWSQRIVSFIQTSDFKVLKTQIEWSCYVSSRFIMIDLESVLSNSPIDMVNSVPGKTSNSPNHSNLESDSYELMDKLVLFCQILSSYLTQPNLPTVCISLDCCKDSLNTWNMIYELCGYSDKVKVCLKLQPVETDIEMWLSEPVKCVVLSEDTFLSNKRVMLNKSVSNQLSVLMKNNVKIVLDSNLNYNSLISNDCFIQNNNDSGNFVEEVVMRDFESEIDVKDVLKAVKRCYSRIGPLTINELYGRGYEDLLQVPLQPLRDNLDSSTYNEFEKCSFKYNCYDQAISSFITTKHGELNQPNNLNSNINYSVYVLGAGRGPLVEVVMDVFRRNHIPTSDFVVYALDKNPYTMLTLDHKAQSNRWANVRLICKDMRELNKSMFQSNGNSGSKPVHLVVSELLGPFGDNELAPECLHGFERSFNLLFNNRVRLEFIPSSYTSYVMPLHCPQIWAKIKSFGNTKNFHMPYTVYLKAYYNVGTMHMDCFKFEHPDTQPPKREQIRDLERYKVMKFIARSDCYVHGFGAYFKCTLFDKVEISILPRDSENVKSWFPMFFPIEIPFPVKKSQVITLHIWRKVNDLKVWYEWAFTTPYTTAIHNVNGHSYSISKC
ncbi:PRMT5 arginine-N-methyltransferase family protein [Theileria parva strain Muguga]|uniref:Protein arginine N-methyltransferase n=1 Tax=Theileria parva TaxID=5875 RepID=Q4N9L4_THEPA|nr:PRMT5 arginine-N-methyltransferase family protein [Theileria parva strain Muguga]EAN33344.1 PRMT5 arginine-N-methyltransferase family protein [Theileria parva strain Muguga]|eukprot:XP_765627.1 kinase binding protein [Theileria parva strain Muguga]